MGKGKLGIRSEVLIDVDEAMATAGVRGSVLPMYRRYTRQWGGGAEVSPR